MKHLRWYVEKGDLDSVLSGKWPKAILPNTFKVFEDDFFNKPNLGVYIEDINENKRKQLNLKSDKGVYVSRITEMSAAQEAGIKGGDIITKIDGDQVNSTTELIKAIQAHKPGDKIKVNILRDNKEMQISATLKSKTNRFSSIIQNNAWSQLDSDMLNFHWDFQFDPNKHNRGIMDELKQENEKLRQEMEQLHKDMEKMKEDMRKKK